MDFTTETEVKCCTWSASKIIDDVMNLVRNLLRDLPESGFLKRLLYSFDHFHWAFLGERISFQFVGQFARHKFIDRYPLAPNDRQNLVGPTNNKTWKGFVINLFCGCDHGSGQIETLVGSIHELVVCLADQIVLVQE